MKKTSILAIIVCLLATVNVALADTFGTGGNAFTIDFVSISGSTNPSGGYGIVNHDYRMGTYEITNDQWDKFKAGADLINKSTGGFYNPYWTGTNVATNRVSWYEAAQFVNYLNTSKGYQAAYKFTGTQGITGYTLGVWQAGDTGYNAGNPYRNSNAKYYLPTEDEWVKAAYWNGTSLQTYANASAGDLVNGLPDIVKWNEFDSIGNGLWAVGSGAEELNGTFDMMGSVMEWMESPYYADQYLYNSERCIRGGSYGNHSTNFASSARVNHSGPSYEAPDVGFRVASVVPEPCSLILLALGGLVLRYRKR